MRTNDKSLERTVRILEDLIMGHPSGPLFKQLASFLLEANPDRAQFIKLPDGTAISTDKFVKDLFGKYISKEFDLQYGQFLMYLNARYAFANSIDKPQVMLNRAVETVANATYIEVNKWVDVSGAFRDPEDKALLFNKLPRMTPEMSNHSWFLSYLETCEKDADFQLRIGRELSDIDFRLHVPNNLQALRMFAPVATSPKVYFISDVKEQTISLGFYSRFYFPDIAPKEDAKFFVSAGAEVGPNNKISAVFGIGIRLFGLRGYFYS